MSASKQAPSNRLRLLRERAGLSKRELALSAGVARNTIIRAEYAVPQRATQVVIADAIARALDEPVGRYDIWPLVENDNDEAA